MGRYGASVTDPRSKAVPADWQGPLCGWTLSLSAAGRSDETIRTRVDHVRRAARALGGSPWAVTAGELVAWCGAQEWARETRRSVYASLRGFWSWGVAAGLSPANPAGALPQVRATDPLPRPAPDLVIERAKSVTDERCRLILRLGAEAGMRRAEIAQVHRDDLTADLVGWSLLVHGKGGRLRYVPLTASLAADLRAACLGGGWAFPGRVGGHLSARRVGELAADALGGPWTAHSLRHRFATTVHDATGDLIAVQHLLGHASVATTQRYVATTDARLRAAAAAAA